MAVPPDTDEFRLAVFAHLDRLLKERGPYLKSAWVNTFVFEGTHFPIMEQNGIRKPRGWAEALAVTSTLKSGSAGGYDDEVRDSRTPGAVWKFM